MFKFEKRQSLGLTLLTLAFPHALEIDKPKYELIRSTYSGINHIADLETKYDLLIENYFELEETLLTLAARYVTFGGDSSLSIHGHRDLINRRIANLLSSCRAYVDQAPQHAKCIQALAQGNEIELPDLLARQYDARLGFRVMEALRNHVQHQDLPIHTWSVQYKWLDVGGIQKLGCGISPSICPKELAANKKFKKTILQELTQLGEKIELLPLIREYVGGISVVHNKLRESALTRFELWGAVIDGLIESFKQEFPDEESMVALAAFERSSEGQLIVTIPINRNTIDYVAHLTAKNRLLANLERRFVTSDSSQVSTA